MTNPKRRIGNQPDLGRAIDERLGARRGELDLRHDTGRPAAAPISQGGSTGGGGGGSNPALFGSYVESVQVAGGAVTAPSVLIHHATGIYPSTAAAAAGVVVSANGGCSLPAGAGAGTLDSSYARWEWTSDNTGGNLTQSQVVLGAACRRLGDTARLKARFRLNDATRLDALYLGLNDADGSNACQNSAQVAITLSGSNDGLWIVADSGAVDIGGWEAALRITLTAQGASTSGFGLTQLDVEWLELAQTPG